MVGWLNRDDAWLRFRLGCWLRLPVVASRVAVAAVRRRTGFVRPEHPKDERDVQRPKGAVTLIGHKPWTAVCLCLLLGAPCGLGQVTSTSVGLRRDVKRLSGNDAVQDQRLAVLEQDVSQLQQKVSYTPRPPSAKDVVPVVPTAAAGTRAPASRAATSYTVKRGDTLWRIAMNHKVSIGELKTVNALKNDTVVEGQRLNIPGREQPQPPSSKPVASRNATAPAPQAAAVRPPPVVSGGTAGYHTVGKGETIYQIAQRYGVSQAALLQSNPGIKPNALAIGAKLRLPTLPRVAVPTAAPAPQVPSAPVVQAPPLQKEGLQSNRYVVQKGESLASIGRKFGVSIEQLMTMNRLSNPNVLQIGQSLQIPVKSGEVRAADGGSAQVAGAGRSSASPANPIQSLRPSAPEPAGTPAALAPVGVPSYPGLDLGNNKAATIGPQPQANHRGVVMYRVHVTDTLETIANTFGTTTERLRQLNGLAPNESVSVDDDIVVPAAAAVTVEP